MEKHADKESYGADNKKIAGGGSISRWQVGIDAGSSKNAPRGRHEVGHAALAGHGPSRRSEQSHMNACARTFRSLSRGAEHHQTLCLNKCAKNSGHYPFSTKTVEFMAVGVPVIVSDTIIDK